MQARLLAASHDGLQVHRVVDVGANKGDWARMLMQLTPHANILMLEANDSHAAELAHLVTEYPARLAYKIAMLAAAAGQTKNFYTSETFDGSGDSMFREVTHFYEQCSVKALQTTTLDALLVEHGWGTDALDILKLDVQGAELEVLRGAACTLGRTDAVIAEVGLFEYNEKAPLFAEVVRFMDEAGFDVVDFLEFHRCRHNVTGERVTLQVDVLFARRGGPFHTGCTATVKDFCTG